VRILFSYKKTLALIFLALLATVSGFSKHKITHKRVLSEENNLYEELQLKEIGLNSTAFKLALKGWNELQTQSKIKTKVLSIMDLSQSSKAKRLYVIDMEKKSLLFNTYAAHGRNSGQEFATSFSNTLNSLKSSLGFYLTEETYKGAHGLSLRLQGIEDGINDIAEQRGIVIHGASYVSETFIHKNGRLGRSHGCPAVAEELCEPIINAIKGGSCFFMYYPDSTYLELSKIL
jgi:hypothetical protein